MQNRNMTKRDYYDVLGVGRSADEAELKRVYRALAMKYHPDKNPGDQPSAERMKELNEAYAVLSNPDKRKLYDAYGHAGLEGYSQEDIFRGVDFSSLFGDLGFGGGVFDQFFGGGGRRSRGPAKGEDLRYDLEVTLEEVAAGVERTIDLSKAETCSKCRGAGAAPGGQVTCDKCRGTGQHVSEKRSGYSVFRQISACGLCRGTGQIIREKCDQCQGKGIISKAKEIKVQIPKGAETGNALRLSGEGGPGEVGAPAGDLYVVLNVKKHPLFQRQGNDLYLQAEVGFVEAALGAKAELPGLDGKLDVDIPEGTQTGSVIRISGEGMPRLSSRGKGDLYVVAKVVTPTNLSEQAKELLRQFGELTVPAAGEASKNGDRDEEAATVPEAAKGKKPLSGAKKLLARKKAKK